MPIDDRDYLKTRDHPADCICPKCKPKRVDSGAHMDVFENVLFPAPDLGKPQKLLDKLRHFISRKS